jgi:hypothetical protein
MKSKVTLIFIFGMVVILIAGCTGGQAALATSTISPSQTPFQPTETQLPPTATPEPTITLTPTPSYPPEGMGPTGFPENVNPFTGLKVANPDLLNRRPVVVKIENLPRSHRPQSGVGSADIVYEYYTEEGTTRFAAVIYGNDSSMVGPIRSGRYFDVNVVQMYKATFVFGYAWAPVFQRFLNSDFGNRLIIENDYTTNTLFRDSANLFLNTAGLIQVYTRMGIDNSRQNEDGMFFQMQIPDGGSPVNSVFARYSGAIYNRWDYDPASGKYYRFSDTDNAFSVPEEKYAPLTDKNTGAQISADNVVIILVQTIYMVHDASGEVVDMTLLGNGSAYIARDGQIFPVQWTRSNSNSVLSLIGADGKPFPFKPGNTWFEVMGTSSDVTQPDSGIWRFVFHIP